MGTIGHILLSKVYAALSSTALLYLFFSAEIQTAPDILPSKGSVIQWMWQWQVHALKMFLNMRNPPPPATATSTVTETSTKSIEVVVPDTRDPKQPTGKPQGEGKS